VVDRLRPTRHVVADRRVDEHLLRHRVPDQLGDELVGQVTALLRVGGGADLADQRDELAVVGRQDVDHVPVVGVVRGVGGARARSWRAPTGRGGRDRRLPGPPRLTPGTQPVQPSSCSPSVASRNHRPTVTSGHQRREPAPPAVHRHGDDPHQRPHDQQGTDAPARGRTGRRWRTATGPAGAGPPVSHAVERRAAGWCGRSGGRRAHDRLLGRRPARRSIDPGRRSGVVHE
jgi:hypothetical protein